MKATLSIAVMALLGHISAAEIMSVPTIDALVQTGTHHHHRKHSGHLKYKKVKGDEIHGYKSPSDDFSPYDPSVVDAPEDIKRVDNDHEELHNAKLSPDGYYTGFFHKDHEGNYSTVKHDFDGSQSIGSADYKGSYSQKKHHHKKAKKHSRKSHGLIQLKDHKKDTDDIVETEDFVQHQYEHDNDTDDVVEEFSDETKVQTKFDHENDSDDVVEEFSDMNEEKRGGLTQRLSQISNQQQMEEILDHDMVDSEDVQINYNHDNDTDDLADGHDPLELAQHKRGDPYKTYGDLMQEHAEMKFDQKVEEISQLQQEQQLEDQAQIQRQGDMHRGGEAAEDQGLVQIGYERIPHENDTDDVQTDGTDMQYNHRHSKEWNQEVNKKAMEIENEIKIEENTKLSQKKANEDAKRKAAQEKVRLAEEKRKKLEEEQKQKMLNKDHINKQTVDLGELYHGIENIEMIGLDTTYDRHSKFMTHLIEQTEKMVDREDDVDGEDEKLGLYASKEERKKIDLDKIEENNNVQLDVTRPYEKHHQAWYDEVEKAADKLEHEMGEAEAERAEAEYKSPFKTVNHEELYENLNLQTSNKYHTDDFNDRVEAYEQQIAAEIKQDDDVAVSAKNQQEDQVRRVLAEGMTPLNMPKGKESEQHHPNPSINLSEMYGTMYHEDASLLQVKFEHEHDNDDIVPELTENVVLEKKAKEVDARKTDFAGEKFTEIYDE